MQKNNVLNEIYEEIDNHTSNSEYKKRGYEPIYSISLDSKIVIVGQAPGKKAQETKIPWNDISGDNLRQWLGVSKEEFYNASNFALLPMDFYYPGKGPQGDLPPRKDFAAKWHPILLKHINNVELTLLVGQYSQKYYLQGRSKRNLTETVRSFADYLPKYFPIVHPSPLTARWQAKNSWFATDVLPELRRKVAGILS